MSEFTPVDSWAKRLQDVVGANEIITAYNERVAVGGYRGQTTIGTLIGGFGYRINPDDDDPDLVRVFAGCIVFDAVDQTDVTVENDDYVYVRHTLVGDVMEVLVGSSVPANDADYIYYGFYRFTVTDGAATIQTVIRTPDNMQSKAPWTTMQGGIKHMCDSNDLCFLDYDLFESNGAALKFTFARLLTAAGITGGLFRRATECDEDGEPIFLEAESEGDYGLIQSGDIVGPWVFEDLQACLSEMLWTAGGSTWGGNGPGFGALGGQWCNGSGSSWTSTDPEASWDKAVANAEANYLAHGNTGNSGNPRADSSSEHVKSDTNEVWAIGFVRGSQSYYCDPSQTSATIPFHHAEVWFTPYLPTNWTDRGIFSDQGDAISEGFHCQLTGPTIAGTPAYHLLGRIGPEDVAATCPTATDEPDLNDDGRGFLGYYSGSTVACYFKRDFTYA